MKRTYGDPRTTHSRRYLPCCLARCLQRAWETENPQRRESRAQVDVGRWVGAAGACPFIPACVCLFVSISICIHRRWCTWIYKGAQYIKPPTRSSGLISKINQHAQVRFTLPARGRARSERVACAHRSSTSSGQCSSEQRRAPRCRGCGLRPVQIEVEMTLGLSRLWQYCGQPKTVAPLDPAWVVHGSAQTLNPQPLQPYVPI